MTHHDSSIYFAASLLHLCFTDLTQDPYFLRNHLGSYECKLCLTLHTNEGRRSTLTTGTASSSHIQSHRHGGSTFTDSQIVNHVLSIITCSVARFHLSFFLKSSRGQAPLFKHLTGSYLAHTQGKKHQINLARRAAREKQVSRQTCGGCILNLSSLYRILWQIPWDDCDVVILLTWCDVHAILDFGGRNNSASATNIFRHDVFCDPGIHGHFWQISISKSGPRKTVKIGRPGYRVTKDMVCEIFEIQTRSHGWAQATQCLCHFWS